jgi:hypothetical protein
MYNWSVHNHAAVQARDRRCFAISVIESQHVQMAFEQCKVGNLEQLAVICDGEGKGGTADWDKMARWPWWPCNRDISELTLELTDQTLEQFLKFLIYPCTRRTVVTNHGDIKGNRTTIPVILETCEVKPWDIPRPMVCPSCSCSSPLSLSLSLLPLQQPIFIIVHIVFVVVFKTLIKIKKDRKNHTLWLCCSIPRSQ